MSELIANGQDRSDLVKSVEGIQKAREKAGVFGEAVHVTRMPMIMTDPSLSRDPIIFANEAFLEMSGYAREDVLGREPYFLAVDNIDEQALMRRNAALARGDRELVELVCRRRDGRTFTAIVSASRISDDQDQVKHFLSFVDTSEHLALQQSFAASERLSRLLIEGVTDYAICMLDPEGRIVSWNSGAERIKGYVADEVLGKHVSLFYGEEDQQSGGPQEALATAEREGRFETESWRVRKDGTKFPAHVIIDAIRSEKGDLIGFAKVTRDITERQRVRDAEHASEAKTQFLASMSHEIRTPLSGIIGYTERLLDENLTPNQRRYAERIQSSGSALLTIINDILDLSQIEAGRTELEEHPFSLETLIDNTVSIISGAAEAKGLSVRLALEPGLPKLLLGDEARLRQVLLNLLNNAVKFTHEGHIGLTVQCQSAPGEGEALKLCVTDTGIGIPIEKRHRLFKRFSQVDRSTRRMFGGSGLGLAISKRLVDLMGGEIGVESREGEGSTFWFKVTLPVAQPEDVINAETSTPVHSVSAHILLAEDLEINQELACSILEEAGHQVDVVADGAEAVAAVKAAAYDLVLMDIQMPVMDGITATKEIRALDQPTRSVPIIAMTANVMPAQLRGFKEAGMDDHIGKPMKRSDLLNKIGAWLPAGPASDESALQEDVPSRPAFDQTAFAELRELVGAHRMPAWLNRLDAQLTDAFAQEIVEGVDREQLRRASHDIVSQAGSLGFFQLSDLCVALEEACISGADLSAPFARARRAAREAREVIKTLQV